MHEHTSPPGSATQSPGTAPARGTATRCAWPCAAISYTLENDMVITDPVAFNRPWIVTRKHRKAPRGTPIMDVMGTQSPRNPIANGQQVLLPTGKPGGAQPASSNGADKKKGPAKPKDAAPASAFSSSTTQKA